MQLLVKNKLHKNTKNNFKKEEKTSKNEAVCRKVCIRVRQLNSQITIHSSLKIPLS